MEKVFITGATGVLGKRVVKKCVQKGIPVAALSRSEKNHSLLLEMGAEPREADLFDAESLTEASRDCTSIMHLATNIPKVPMPDKPRYWELNDRIRTEGTEALLRAADNNNISRFIQQSITLIYGNQNGKEVTPHTAPANPPLFMIRSAIEMENLVRRKKDTNHVILRFGQFYSGDSYTTREMIANIRKRKLPVIGKGDFIWNNIHVDDAADAVIYSYQNFEKLKNKTLNISDFSPMEFGKMVHGVAELTGSKKPFSVPRWMAKILIKPAIFGFLTSSFRVSKDPALNDWAPANLDFLSGIKKILGK